MVKFLTNEQVQIGQKVVRFRNFDPPFRDGSTRVVEATSDPTSKYEEILDVADLKGTTGSMLPTGFQIAIYRPMAQAKGLDSALFENLKNGRQITVSMNYYYESWEQINLLHSVNRLCARIGTSIDYCRDIRISRSEVAIDLLVLLFTRRRGSLL